MFPHQYFLFGFKHYVLHSELSNHTTRNYLFEVAGDGEDLPIFDAAHLGNATRFLNHKDHDGSNVEAKSMSSNISYGRRTDNHVTQT